MPKAWSVTVVILLAFASAIAAATSGNAGLSERERASGYCVGVIMETEEYYSRHPEFFVLNPFAERVTSAMQRKLDDLTATGLSHAHPLRPVEDQAELLAVEDAGIKERKTCEDLTYTCSSQCFGPAPPPIRADRCRSLCEEPERTCRSSVVCLHGS